MNQTLNIIEFGIVIAAKNYDPSLLNPSILMGSGIVPSDWEIARQPIFSSRASQVVYSNGVNLVAQPNRLIAIESLTGKTEQSVGIPEVACRYVEVLPNLDYQAVGISFRGYIPFSTETSQAREYLFKTLFAPGAWQSMGTAPVQAALNFLYTFDSKRLNLSLNEASLQLPEGETMSVILFSGNFEYDLSVMDGRDRVSKLQEIVKNWQADKQLYSETANKFVENYRFPEMVFPVEAYAS